jgi:hypothetical protein
MPSEPVVLDPPVDLLMGGGVVRGVPVPDCEATEDDLAVPPQPATAIATTSAAATVGIERLGMIMRTSS